MIYHFREEGVMPITESKKDKSKIEDNRSANAAMAQAKIELALLKYKVAVGGSVTAAEGKKKVRL
jgi:hypothetical protein